MNENDIRHISDIENEKKIELLIDLALGNSDLGKIYTKTLLNSLTQWF